MADVSALDAAAAVLEDVDSLLDNHPSQKDHKPGKPSGKGYGPLLRSSTALCYTAWEVYVEEALLETVQRLTGGRVPEELPSALRDWVASEAASGKDGRKWSPWCFVGDSWKSTVHEMVQIHVRGNGKTTFGLNTANPSNVSKLYKSVLGYDPLQDVKWQKKSNRSVKADIGTLVRLRGEIVHRGSTPEDFGLNLQSVRSWAEFVRRLTEKFDECLKLKSPSVDVK